MGSIELTVLTLGLNTVFFVIILFLILEKVNNNEQKIPLEVEKEINLLEFDKKENERRFEYFIKNNDSMYQEQARLREKIKNCREELRTKDILIKILSLRLDNDDEKNILLDIEEKLSPLGKT